MGGGGGVPVTVWPPLWCSQFLSGEPAGEFVRGLDHGNGVELLEAFGESVLEAPQTAGLKFLVRRVEVSVVYRPRQVAGYLQRPFNERLVNKEAGGNVGELGVLPAGDVLNHGVEVALHLVHAVSESQEQFKVFSVLLHDGGKISPETQVVADQDFVADGDSQREGLVVAVADAEGEAYAVAGGFQFHCAKELHTVFGNGVLVFNYANMPEAEGFNQGVDHFVVRHNLVGQSGIRVGYECQLLPANRSCL